MTRTLIAVCLAALLSGVAFGQTPSRVFDVADVHVSARTTNPNFTGGVLRAGRYDLRRATMVDLIRTAYGVDPDKVVGGPSWLETDRFDVVAKAPQSTSPDNLKLMLQALLADRFKLKVHTDNKTIPAFVLTLGKGKPKLKESEGAGSPGCQPVPQNPEPGTIPYNVASCHNMTMEALAQNLRGMANAYVTAPVVDQTGLKGTFDFELKWTGRGLLAQAGADGISIFDAVDRQLGLKLEPKEIPAPVILVDSVNQKPSDNPAGVNASLPPAPPAEFEVADIKPTMPGATGQFARIQNGRVDVQGIPLKQLIQIAWDINSEDMLAGSSKGLDTRYDIIAKVSSAPAAEAQQIDIDVLRQMVRALLIDRFKLKTHTEDRPVASYTLMAAKPKLTKADPSARTSCKEGPAPTARDPRNSNPVLSRLVTCQNMTMAQFADRLPSLASGYIRTPVLDATGIEGAYDFTFNFSPIGAIQGGGGRGGDTGGAAAGAGGALSASEPTGALSLLDALPRQLGLKLELEKRPMPVLVIDHAEEKPNDN